ncbi:MAG: hypothetical protein Q9195_009177 [Heterodermia aff. obscurata]
MTGRGRHEPLKVAIQQSRRIALARCLIHGIPVGFALFEIILNWNNYYVGVHTYSVALYQLGAKIHEIMIQASLAAIIFSFVRHELVLGGGLPFGSLFSALQVNQISYLWSMEYWGSIRSHLVLWRKIRLLIIIALCIALGSLSEQVPVANALFSAANLWQLTLTNVTSRHGHGNPLSDQSNSIHTIENGVYQPYVTSYCAQDTYTGEDDKRPLVFPTLLGANDGSQTDNSIQQDFGPVPGITKSGVLRSDLLRTSEVESDFRLKWIELSENNFNGSSIGAVILLPKHDGNLAQEILTCNLAAGWGSTKLKYDSGQSKMIDIPKHRVTAVPIELSYLPEGEQGIDYITFDYPYFPQKPINITRSWAELLSTRLEYSNTTVFNEIMQEQVWKNDTRDYASYVLSGLVANGLARLGYSSGLQGAVKTISKNGNTELDGNYWLSGKGDAFIVNATEAKNWTKLHMTSELQGHAYNTAGLAPKVAICVLTTYCVLALCHIFYAGYTGISSTSWDSIAEVTALAINSTPSECLRNTCAGITELHIFKLPVRILTARDTKGEGEHLELVFGDVPEEKSGDVIKPNRAYGSMAATKSKQS